ncbi:hypothetical protein [Luteimonas saliphila]|nr:hypothetical protein [Luteimonas saliphila]
MDSNNQTARQAAANDDFIVLGTASTDTHGPGVAGEGNGTPIGVGISEE